MKPDASPPRRKMPSQSAPGSGRVARHDRPAVGRWHVLLAIGLIVGLGIVCYANTFGVPFVLDDDTSILYNPAIRDWTNLRAIWEFSPNRFLTYWTLAWNYRLGGLHPAGYHFVNLAIHIGSALVVFWLIQMLLRTPALWFSRSYGGKRAGLQGPLERGLAGGAKKHGSAGDSGDLAAEGLQTIEMLSPHMFYIALFVALLFVCHPVQTQAVTYIIQRTASLAGFCYLVAMACYSAFRLARIARKGAGKPLLGAYGWLAMALLATIAAMFSKQNALTLPFAILLLEFCFFSPSKEQLKRAAPWLLLFFLTLPLTPATMLFSQNLNWGEISELGQETRSISRWHYLLTQFSVIRTYLRLLVFPVGQNLDYDYAVSTSLGNPATALSLLFLLGLASSGIWLFQHNRPAAFGILFFFLTLSVESSVIPIADVIFEHRLYLPAFGIFLAAASLSQQLLWKGPDVTQSPRILPRLPFLFAAVFLVIFTTATIRRNHVWRSTLAIWSDTAEKSPNKARPQLNLGSAWQERGRLDLAQQYYVRALELKPNFPEALANLGGILAGQGRLDESVRLCQAALKINPRFAVAHSNLAVALSLQGRGDEALLHFEKALEYRPFYKLALFNWGYALLLRGKPNEAIEKFRKVLRIDPEYADAYLDWGMALQQLGRKDEAIIQFREALRLRPDWAEAKSALSQATVGEGSP